MTAPEPKIDALLQRLACWPETQLAADAAATIRALRAEHEALRADWERVAETASLCSFCDSEWLDAARARWAARRAQQEKTP